jgi:acyl-coenzyme A synthetase/AMP-(fatty) acid ligase
MPQSDRPSLSDALVIGGHRPKRFLWGTDASVCLSELYGGSSLGDRLEELRGRSVFLAAKDQLTAALALIELDRIARRLVLCPPDLPVEHIPSVMATAAADAIVSDRVPSELGAPNIRCFITCSPSIEPASPRPSGDHQTEWILLTSGTTGMPKLVVHTL